LKRIVIVIGTRPNFIKVTQFKRHAASYGLEVLLVHTGQHFDHNMAGVFFEQFGLQPDVFLSVEARHEGEKSGETIVALSKVFQELKPDLAIAVGDVNSTLACAVAAQKSGIPLAHLESGLRSGDRSMPEEINRVVTDAIADCFFITEQSGVDHLLREGKAAERMHLIGNTMIDTMVAYDSQIEASSVLDDLKLEAKRYALMTFHRPALVDDYDGLKFLTELITELSSYTRLVLPLHPRTRKNLEMHGFANAWKALPQLVVTDPMGYFEFQKLVRDARWVLTDSGGIQEETTFRGVPCLTLRPNTERPVTVDLGTNTLVSMDQKTVVDAVRSIENGTYKAGRVPPLWDGHSTERCLQIIAALLNA
jgi:UDP-N-acetylglucosamine 2-epimerase (non-hydrolysing)